MSFKRPGIGDCSGHETQAVQVSFAIVVARAFAVITDELDLL